MENVYENILNIAKFMRKNPDSPIRKKIERTWNKQDVMDIYKNEIEPKMRRKQ